MIELVAGDHIRKLTQIVSGRPLTLAAQIRARLVNLQTGDLGDTVTVDLFDPETDLANNSVILEFPSANTTSWPIGAAKIEVEVREPEPDTFFVKDILVHQQTII